MQDATALVFEDYNKGVLVPAVIEGAIQLATTKRVPIVVEASCRAGEEMIRLLAGEEQIIAVDARDFGARVLVHAVQQPGAFDVVRQILSLRGCSLHLHPAAGLAGCRFDQVHATVADGVLIGLVRGGAVLLSPAGGEAIAPEDQLLVIADHASRPRHDASLPGIPEGALPPPSEVPPIRSLHILVARHKPELAAMLEFLGPVPLLPMAIRFTPCVATSRPSVCSEPSQSQRGSCG